MYSFSKFLFFIFNMLECNFLS